MTNSMRYLIFLILAGFTGVTAWGQTSTTARPMAVNDTLTEDSTYALQEVVVRTSPVKRKADRFILSVPPAQNKDGVELLQQAPGVWLSDERISINGSSGTKVFVDNREIKLTGEMLIGYLRSLNRTILPALKCFQWREPIRMPMLREVLYIL